MSDDIYRIDHIQRVNPGFLRAQPESLERQLIMLVEILEQWAKDDARCPDYCSYIAVLRQELKEWRLWLHDR
jgi:hypothetical protein